MKILGIETATAVCAAAIVDDDSVIIERKIEAPQVHSEKLIKLIDECLQTVSGGLNGIDGIAISIGPGSFTGLRIGLSVAKGLAFAAGKPLVSVHTLHALALRAIDNQLVNENELVFPMIDARRDEVYTALFRKTDGKLREIVSSCAMPVNELIKLIPEAKRIFLIGDGVEKFHQHLKKAEIHDFSSYIVISKNISTCSAATVAMIGKTKLAADQEEEIASLEPLYVKDFYTLVKTQHHKV